MNEYTKDKGLTKQLQRDAKGLQTQNDYKDTRKEEKLPKKRHKKQKEITVM